MIGVDLLGSAARVVAIFETRRRPIHGADDADCDIESDDDDCDIESDEAGVVSVPREDKGLMDVKGSNVVSP